MLLFQVVIMTFIIIQNSEEKSLNVLGIFPYHGKSHFIAHERILKELAKRGHNVTVISYFPQSTKMKNYHDIKLNGTNSLHLGQDVITDPSYFKALYIGYYLIATGTNNCKILLSDENVQDLLRCGRKFDIVITEQFNSDCSLGVAYKMDAPVVGITSTSLMAYHFNRFGVPRSPAYTPFQLLKSDKIPNLLQRMERAIFNIYFEFVKMVSQSIDQYTLNQYLGNIPPLEELGSNIKFLLINEYFLFFSPYAFPTNVIPIGGLHVKEAKPLPLELQKFINGSKHGVIYISFGSMLKTSLMPTEKIEAIIRATEKLPQRVIWKSDLSVLPGQSEKIYLNKWLPQSDVLGHPNVIAMYSHGGLLGLTEAIHHGVPVIAMPVIGDQPRNAAAAEDIGLGVQIQVSEVTEEILLQKLRTILDPGFRENVKRLSIMWRDRPISVEDNAVYWIEYAARYHNFTFRSAAADVPFYQYFCLDLLFCFIVSLVLIFFPARFVLRSYITKKSTIGPGKNKWKRS